MYDGWNSAVYKHWVSAGRTVVAPFLDDGLAYGCDEEDRWLHVELMSMFPQSEAHSISPPQHDCAKMGKVALAVRIRST